MSPGCNFLIRKIFPRFRLKKLFFFFWRLFFDWHSSPLIATAAAAAATAGPGWNEVCKHRTVVGVKCALPRPLKKLIFVLEGGTNQIDSTVGQWKGKIRIILIILIKQLMRKKNSTCNCFINLWVVTLQTISIRKRDKDREREKQRQRGRKKQRTIGKFDRRRWEGERRHWLVYHQCCWTWARCDIGTALQRWFISPLSPRVVFIRCPRRCSII